MSNSTKLVAYSNLSDMQVAGLKRAATRIFELQSIIQDSTVAIGQELITVRDSVPEDSFIAWCNQELGYSYDTALNLIHVAEQLHDVSPNILANIKTKAALYLIAQPSLDPNVRSTILDFATSNEVSYELAVVMAKAPGYMRDKVSSGTLSLADATEATKAYQGAMPDVQSVCQKHSVANSDTIKFLQSSYIKARRYGGNDADTTWRDVTRHGTLTHDGQDMPLADVTRHEIDIYLQERQFEHITSKSKREVIIEKLPVTVVNSYVTIALPVTVHNETIFVSIWREKK